MGNGRDGFPSICAPEPTWMSPVQSVISVILNSVNFRGRARRSEFWWFFLAAFVSTASLTAAMLLLAWKDAVPLMLAIAVIAAFPLALQLPVSSVAVRRLHDADRSGRWIIAPVAFFLVESVIMALGWVLLQGFFGGWGWGDFLDMESDPKLWLGRLSLGLFIMGQLGNFLTLATVVAWIVPLVFLAMPGTRGPNRYGPDPLQANRI